MSKSPINPQLNGKQGQPPKTDIDITSRFNRWIAFIDRLHEPSTENPTAELPVPLKNELKRAQSVSNRALPVPLGGEKCLISDEGADQVSLQTAGTDCDDWSQSLRTSAPALPDRWVDFFCIVGPKLEGIAAQNVDQEEKKDDSDQWNPTLLDCYPKVRTDMELPDHLSTFCLPRGCKPAMRRVADREPTIHTIVLTSSSGSRLYGSVLTVHEEVPQQQEDTTSVSEQATTSPRPWKRFRMSSPPPPSTTSDEASATTATTTITVSSSTALFIPKCIVLLSHYPLFVAQSTMLRELWYTVSSKESPLPLERFVAHIVDDIPFPSHVEKTRVDWYSWYGNTSPEQPPDVCLERPGPDQFPLWNCSMEPLWRTISVSNWLVLWAMLVLERRVVLCCDPKHVALLTPIAHALSTLLFPLEWQGLYIPTLPRHMIDFLDAPVPFLIGIPATAKELFQHSASLLSNGNGGDGGSTCEVVVCDLDTDVIYVGGEAVDLTCLLPALPEAASLRLKADLEAVADPLYLPSMTHFSKGRIDAVVANGATATTIELDNSQRPLYAQRSKLSNNRPSPRRYVLSQSAQVPPRHFVKQPSADGEPKETFRCSNAYLPTPDIRPIENIPSSPLALTKTSSKRVTKPKPNSIVRRNIQARADWFLAAITDQCYAKPSPYTPTGPLNNVLEQQDEISAKFFNLDSTDKTDCVRHSFLRFFTATLLRYQYYVDPVAETFDAERFVQSLKLPKQQAEFMTTMVQSQMFERFLRETDTGPGPEGGGEKRRAKAGRRSSRRRLFDDYIVLHHKHMRQRDATNEFSSTPLKSSVMPRLDSKRWIVSRSLVTPFPCRIGIDEDRKFLTDGKFPSRLDPEEVVTSNNIPSWKAYYQGTLCSAFFSCT